MLINPKHCALIFLLIGLINAGPLKRSEKSLLNGDIKCAKTCTDSKNFNYQIGRSYRYSFETKNAFTPETGNPLNEVKISGHAKITIQSNCEHILKLENLNVEGASNDQKSKLVSELEAHNLAYSFQDGEIANVCPLSEELKWTLNVKKAILSALQVAPKTVLTELSTANVEEKDINGNCETTYEMQSSNTEQYKIIKSKNLKSCGNRMSVNSPILGNSPLAGDLVNMYMNTFVQSDHRCKVTINKKTGIVDSVKCTQSSDGPKAIQKDLRTHNEITLKFSNEDPVHYPQPKGEYYEDSLHGERVDLDEDHNVKNVQANELKNSVSDLCRTISTATILTHSTAAKFRELVNKIRHSKDSVIRGELNNLLEQRNRAKNAKNHEHAMQKSTCCPHKLFKLYIDALISAKSDESLKILVNELVPQNFYLQEGSARAELKLVFFYTSLAFYRDSTEDTLKAALPLLELKGRHNRNALFGLTGLARAVCKKDKKCSIASVDDLANKIANRIPANCAASASNEHEVIENLKALENLPKLPESALKKVTSCLSSSASPAVKVSAIKNFDHKLDEETVKKAIRDTLMNSNEQDEVRIAAYRRYRKQVTKENAKEIEKLVSPAKSELASYIANDIQRLRSDRNLACPVMKAFVENTRDIDLKVSSQQGKSKMVVGRPMRLFFKSNLVVYTDVVYSQKTEKPISVTSSFRLHNKEILEVGLRSESGSNLLLNAANVETLVDGLMQLVKNVNAKQEDGKARLIDEWAASVFPELAKAFKDVDMHLKVGGRNLIFLSKNDQSVAVGNRLDKLKLGLALIFAYDWTSDLQVHSVSGLPTLVRKDRTFISNFVLFESEAVSNNEVKFEIAPNLVMSQLLKVSFPIGRHLNTFNLENEQHLTTNFGLQGKKTDKGDKTEIRLKLNSQKVELMSHRVYNRIRTGDSVKEVPSARKNRDLCLEHFMPLKKMLGVSICSKNNDEEKSVVLEKADDSNVLITLQEEKSANKLTIEQENSPQKRKISVVMSRDQPGSRTLNVDIENPMGKGYAKITTSKDKLSIQAKMNDQQVYSLDADKSLETKGKESNFKAKVTVSFPGLTKPFVSAFTTKVINDKKLQVSGELTVNENTRLVVYEYSAEGQYSRMKRATNDYSLKTDLDLKVFNMKGKTLLHSKYDADYKSTSARMAHLIEYNCPKTDKLEKIEYKSNVEWEHGSVEKLSMVNEFKSSHYPKLNFKYDQKFVYKYEHRKLEHYENDINIELDALAVPGGSGEERKIRLGHVSTLNNFYRGTKKSSMDHLIRIVINRLNYNREINYNGNYELLTDNIYQVDDKLKIQDISLATEVLSAAVSLKADNPEKSKFKLVVDYNCNKHGKFNWAEDMNYDTKTKAVSTKIVLTVSRSDQEAPTVYNGEYTANDFWSPKVFDLKLRKAADNAEVLHIQRDNSKPTEMMTSIDYYGKRVYDFELKLAKDRKFESLKLIVDSVGELKLDKANTAEGDKLTYKLKMDSPTGAYQQNAALVYGKKVLNLEFSATKGDKKRTQLELFLSNPKKTLVTYRDIESGSILLKVLDRQLSFKHENQPTGFSSMLELQRLDTKHKLILMSIKDATKLAIMTKLEKDGLQKYSLDSTFSKNSPSIITYKSEVVTLNLNVNPFGANDDDWKVLTLDFSRKDGKYKHTSKINIKKLDKKHALALKSASSGKRSDGRSFEHSFDSQVSNDWSSVKLNAKISEDNKVDELDYQHEYVRDKNGCKLDHNVKLSLKNELIFKHEMKSKIEHDNKNWKMASESEFKAKCPYMNGVKIDLKGNCNTQDRTGKLDLNLEYPHRNRLITVSYNAINTLKENFMRDLKVEVTDTKLNEKDTYLAKVDLIKGLEIHLKYNKQSKAGHNLENLEMRVLSKQEEHSIVIVAHRGWSGHVKVLPPNKDSASFSVNLTKRGRVLLAIDSKAQLKKREGSRLRRSINWNDEVSINTVIGFNGNTKFAEESIDLTREELKYKFTSGYINVDAQVKGLNKEKKTLYIKGCSATQVTNCALLDANIERSPKGAKSTGSFKYGLGEEAISVTFDYNRQKLDNGDNKGELKGDINGKKFTGEISSKRNGELSVKINLPERVIQFDKVVLTNGYKYTLLPNAVKDKAHEHTLTVVSDKSSPRKYSTQIEMKHPSLKRPMRVEFDSVNQNGFSILLTLDIADDEKKKLYLHTYKTNDGKHTVKHGLRFHREDGKIDFGYSEEKMDVKDSKTTKMSLKRSQHWVDKEGKNRTIIRNEEVELQADSTGNVFDVTSKTLYQTLAFFFEMNGKMHLDLKQRLANGVYDWVVNKDKKKTEFNYKNKCLTIDSYQLPKESYQSNHLINLCVVGRSSVDDLMKFEYVQPQLDGKKRVNNVEQLLFKLSKAEEQQLRLTMHWNPELIGEAIVSGGEWIEEEQKNYDNELNEIQVELEHKWSLLAESLMNDVILPMRKHRQEEINAIISEINPKLAAKLRSKRAVSAKNNKNETEGFLGFSENLAKKLFNLKVIKFSPEEGQIEITFRPNPSFDGIKYGVKSSFQMLFKE